MDFQPIIDAARLGQGAALVREVGNTAYYFLPDPEGNKIVDVSLEAGLSAPLRKRGTIQVFDPASFNAILNANQGGDITIYINRDVAAPSITALLNGNGETGPGWGDFRAEIVFRPTPQWTKWKGIDGKMMPQVQFAEFIEDNLEDVVDPTGATMLEIATYLQTTRTVNFKSGMRLSSGLVQFVNEESQDTKVGSGSIAVPETIVLGLAPVFGLPPFRIPARFRYRLSEGKLTLGVKLQRVEDVMMTVVNDMVNGTAASEGRPVVQGIVAPAGTVMVEGVAPGVTK